MEPSLCLFYRLCIFPNFDGDVFLPLHLCIAECKHITELLERLGILHHFFRSKVGICDTGIGRGSSSVDLLDFVFRGRSFTS